MDFISTQPAPLDGLLGALVTNDPVLIIVLLLIGSIGYHTPVDFYLLISSAGKQLEQGFRWTN
jgi:hypothetical protein